MPKDATVLIRLTAEQKEVIRAAAEREGLSVSAYALRTLLLAARETKGNP